MDHQKLSPEEEITLKAYDSQAERWAREHNTSNIHADLLKIFQEFLDYLPHGKVLEIGCGGGRDAKMLIDAGYDYYGTDVSQGLIDIANHNCPEARLSRQGPYTFDFANNFFDGVWTFATLLHVPKSRINECLQEIARLLRPNGVCFMYLKQGEGESMEWNEEYKFNRFFAYYTQGEFMEILEQNGFMVEKFICQPRSVKTVWLCFFTRL